MDQKFLPSQNFQSQDYLTTIEDWTEQNIMKLNLKKNKVMILNFTNDFQFSTRLYMEDTLLEIIPQTKLLGTILSSDMKSHDNTEMLVIKAYKRMMILHKLYSFHVSDT